MDKKKETDIDYHNNPYSILHVDDESLLLEMSKCYLERTREFIVDTAESVDDALNLFNIKSYDAIISDYNMPGKNGIFFLIQSARWEVPYLSFFFLVKKEMR